MPQENKETLALRFKQMARKAYVNKAPDIRNAQMNDALVIEIDPQLARIAFKNIANHKSPELEPQLLFAQEVEKIHQEDNTRTHIDRHKISMTAGQHIDSHDSRT